jgi:hypothetical protein
MGVHLCLKIRNILCRHRGLAITLSFSLMHLK